MTSKYPMQAVQAQHLAAHVVNLDDISFSAANANVGAVVYDSDFIAWDTTLEEAQAAWQRVEDKRRAQWSMLLEQDSSWAQSTPQDEDISYPWRKNELDVRVRQCLNFDMPMLDADGEGA